jgi:hypothetical protein
MMNAESDRLKQVKGLLVRDSEGLPDSGGPAPFLQDSWR